ncbi:MAG TPA: MTAP family purine nucleoside phosphorylase [Solirubrobacteraceae bacterium]|nr:MTAP family purine nucleoside phosphorylase [Solirubrobacteraceae bacterium]
MPVAIITGSGTHSLPGFAAAEIREHETPFGPVEISRGALADVDVLHVSRHGAGHVRLSHQVQHRANIWALRELETTAVVGCTACGAVDPSLQLGSLVVFDDLHFPSNRLPDGSLCTVFVRVADPQRGHWVLHGGPFSEEVRRALLDAAAEAGHAARDGGTYGHVDGPRFNTPSEIAQLAGRGVVAVSQTGGPETVLCGELELPFALMGFVTDYANEVMPGEPTPVTTLQTLMSRSSAVFADVLAGAVRRLSAAIPSPAGTMFRLGGT